MYGVILVFRLSLHAALFFIHTNGEMWPCKGYGTPCSTWYRDPEEAVSKDIGLFQVKSVKNGNSFKKERKKEKKRKKERKKEKKQRKKGEKRKKMSARNSQGRAETAYRQACPSCSRPHFYVNEVNLASVLLATHPS